MFGHGGTPTRYDVEYRAGTSGSWTTVSRTTTSYTITGQTDNTAYQVRVTAYSSESPGGVVSVISTATTFDVPDAPTSLSFSIRAETSLTLTWVAPADNGGAVITRYEFKLSTASTWMQHTDLNSLSANIVSLTAGTEYTVQLRAVSPVGNGRQASITASTMPSTPAVSYTHLTLPTIYSV